MTEPKKLTQEQNSEADSEADKVEKAENQVSSAVDLLVDNTLDDDAPIEADGDVFWTIQRLFWGIIKSVVVLGGILLILWFIWRPDTAIFEQIENLAETPVESVEPDLLPPPIQAPAESAGDSEGFFARWFAPSGEEVSTPDTTPDTGSESNTEPVSSPFVENSVQSTSSTGIDLAYELEANRQANSGNTIPRSIEWLKRAKNLGEVSLEVVRIREPNLRAVRIEEVLVTADQLFSDSTNLQQQLILERDQLLLQGQTQNEQTGQLDATMKAQIAALEPSAIESLLDQKIESQQLAVFYMGQARLRDTLLRNVQNFDLQLRQKSIPLLSPATEIRAR